MATNRTAVHPDWTDSSDFNVDHSTLVDLLGWRAANQPDRLGYTFLANGEEEEINLTYAELDFNARAIAGH